MEDMQKPILYPVDDPNAIYYDSVSIKPLLKLDKVLEYLHDDKPPGKTLAEIDAYVKRKYGLELGQSNTILALNKMINEGYAAIEERPAKDPNGIGVGRTKTYYNITFDGVLLYKNGGYTQKTKDDEIKSKRKEALDKRLSNGTALLAIATFLLVFLELVRWCLSNK
jgi:hypothetical protein